MEKNTKKKLFFVYALFITLLAIVSIVLVISNICGNIDISKFPYFVIQLIINIIFTIDYFIRFYFSKNKKKFFKKNIFDLIAILPIGFFIKIFNIHQFLLLESLAKLSNFAKFARLFRIINSGIKIRKRTGRFFKTNGFIYALYASGSFILFCSILLTLIEKWNLFDSIWYSIVTCATVGYGDFLPQTTAGKLIGMLLMVVGVGLLGMITGTVTTYFTHKHKRKNLEREVSKEFFDNYQKLSTEQMELVNSIVKNLLNKESIKVVIKSQNIY